VTARGSRGDLLIDVSKKQVLRGVVTSFEGDYGKVEEMPGVEFVVADEAAGERVPRARSDPLEA
jgi:hypothetical protein